MALFELRCTAVAGKNARMGVERQQIQPLFLTVKEAASILRISDWTLWAMIRAPKNSGIPVKRVGRSIRFPTKRFLKWAGEE